MTSPDPILRWAFLGQVPYEQAWRWQKQLRQQRIAGEIEDTLLLLEHPPTITLGRLRGEKSLRHPVDTLATQGVTVIRSDRGGDATLHAPGQLVGYLIVDLNQRQRKLPVFVEQLAEAFIAWLASLHIEAHYDTKYPGVWVGDKKIVAFGFHLEKNVTMHGFALNLHTDLALFDLIVPCGIQDKGVTSSAQEGQTVTLANAAQALAPRLAQSIGLIAEARDLTLPS